MQLTTFTLLMMLAPAQTAGGPTPTQDAADRSAADRSAAAATASERAALAAERAAAAAERAAAAAARAAESRTSSATPPPPAAGGGAAPAAATTGWAGSIGAGLIWLQGNSETLTLSANLALQKQTEDWIYSLKANAIYGQALLPSSVSNQGTQVLALAGGALLRGDRRFTKQVTGYLAAGADTDHVKSIEYRVTGEGGSGVTWLEHVEGDLTKLLLRTDLGLRYSRESRFQYYPTHLKVGNVDLLGPRLGIAYRYALSRDLIFTEDLEVIPNIIGDARWLLNSLSKLSVRMNQILSFATSLQLNHDSAPAPGKKDTDTILTVGLEFAI